MTNQLDLLQVEVQSSYQQLALALVVAVVVTSQHDTHISKLFCMSFDFLSFITTIHQLSFTLLNVISPHQLESLPKPNGGPLGCAHLHPNLPSLTLVINFSL